MQFIHATTALAQALAQRTLGPRTPHAAAWPLGPALSSPLAPLALTLLYPTALATVSWVRDRAPGVTLRPFAVAHHIVCVFLNLLCALAAPYQASVSARLPFPFVGAPDSSAASSTLARVFFLMLCVKLIELSDVLLARAESGDDAERGRVLHEGTFGTASRLCSVWMWWCLAFHAPGGSAVWLIVLASLSSIAQHGVHVSALAGARAVGSLRNSAAIRGVEAVAMLLGAGVLGWTQSEFPQPVGKVVAGFAAAVMLQGADQETRSSTSGAAVAAGPASPPAPSQTSSAPPSHSRRHSGRHSHGHSHAAHGSRSSSSRHGTPLPPPELPPLAAAQPPSPPAQRAEAESALRSAAVGSELSPRQASVVRATAPGAAGAAGPGAPAGPAGSVAESAEAVGETAQKQGKEDAVKRSSSMVKLAQITGRKKSLSEIQLLLGASTAQEALENARLLRTAEHIKRVYGDRPLILEARGDDIRVRCSSQPPLPEEASRPGEPAVHRHTLAIVEVPDDYCEAEEKDDEAEVECEDEGGPEATATATASAAPQEDASCSSSEAPKEAGAEGSPRTPNANIDKIVKITGRKRSVTEILPLLYQASTPREAKENARLLRASEHIKRMYGDRPDLFSRSPEEHPLRSSLPPVLQGMGSPPEAREDLAELVAALAADRDAMARQVVAVSSARDALEVRLQAEAAEREALQAQVASLRRLCRPLDDASRTQQLDAALRECAEARAERDVAARERDAAAARASEAAADALAASRRAEAALREHDRAAELLRAASEERDAAVRARGEAEARMARLRGLGVEDLALPVGELGRERLEALARALACAERVVGQAVEELRMCRACGRERASVLLLECRHLCVCRACRPAVGAQCPVCHATVASSIDVVA
eukprot:m51a1_g6266 hypothetical protein (890) ;mRNA; r:136249-139940